MKLLSVAEHKIKKIEFNNYWKSTTCSVDSILVIKDHIYDRSYNYQSNRFYRNHYGIFLGTKEELEKELLNNKFSGLPKTLYFTSCSKFPRHKATEAKIKRKLSPEAADAIVSDFIDVYQSRYDCRGQAKGETSVYIFYSKQVDYYYYAERQYSPPSYIYSGIERQANESWFENKFALKYGMDFIKPLVEYYSMQGGLPNDIELVYNGPVCFCGKEQTEVLSLTIDAGMKLIYDTELDTVIVSGQTELDNDSLDQIDKMLQSEDISVVGMAMKLMTNCNYKKHMISIGVILANRWDKCTSNTVFKSKAFQQMLSYLEYPTSPSSYVNTANQFNKLYKKCTNEEDKEALKESIIKVAQETIEESKKKILRDYDSLGLNIEISIT